jgi:hypothetical protein
VPKHKFYRYTMDGELSPTDAVAALGAAAAEGQLVRVDTREGQTHVYLAVAGAPKAEVAAARTIEEVTERDVTDLRKA